MAYGNLDEMIEQYKREMMEIGKKSKDSARQTESAVQKSEENTRVEEMQEQETKVIEKERTVTEKREEETAEREVNTDTYAMLCNLSNSCTADGESLGKDKNNCRQLNEFLEENCETGTLCVDVFAWDSEYGIENAKVVVMAPLEQGNVIVHNCYTDNIGKTGPIVLPSPPREASLTQYSSGEARYAAYTILVEHPGYRRALFTNVPVFAGVRSVQPVNLFADVEGTDKNGNAETENVEPDL